MAFVWPVLGSFFPPSPPLIFSQYCSIQFFFTAFANLEIKNPTHIVKSKTSFNSVKSLGTCRPFSLSSTHINFHLWSFFNNDKQSLPLEHWYLFILSSSLLFSLLWQKIFFFLYILKVTKLIALPSPYDVVSIFFVIWFLICKGENILN